MNRGYQGAIGVDLGSNRDQPGFCEYAGEAPRHGGFQKILYGGLALGVLMGPYNEGS